ncbi:MAG: hypothetical protein AAGE37_12695 [Pseudomonadota bacterium]
MAVDSGGAHGEQLAEIVLAADRNLASELDHDNAGGPACAARFRHHDIGWFVKVDPPVKASETRQGRGKSQKQLKKSSPKYPLIIRVLVIVGFSLFLWIVLTVLAYLLLR